MKKTKLNSLGIAVTCLLLAGTNNVVAADLHVPAEYATIQAAVDAASSGDTIHIAPGVYVEQVQIIHKNLTLIGQPGTILRAFPNMGRPFPTVNWSRAILLVNETEHVTIRGLTFEGEQLAGDQFDPLTGQSAPGLRGVWIDVAGGSVEDCRFTGFREKTPGSRSSTAIFFWNGFDGAARYEAHVSNTTIVDSYTGIYIQGADDVISYDVTVVDNTIAGVGLTTANDLLEGLRLGDGTVGTVARNTISGFAYDGPIGPPPLHPIPFGILRLSEGFPDNTLPLEPMTFKDNVLRSNQVHLASFMADDSVVRNNTFEGNVPLTEEADPQIVQAAAGLWFSGADVQVIGNQFSDLEQGIRLAAQGDFLGTATNAMLVDNRFCTVVTNIVTEIGASATEQGTLICPIPDPVLRLSWPGIEQGFSVQSAPNPNGPWSTLDAALIRQDGQNSVVVPADSEQQFFRLAKP